MEVKQQVDRSILLRHIHVFSLSLSPFHAEQGQRADGTIVVQLLFASSFLYSHFLLLSALLRFSVRLLLRWSTSKSESKQQQFLIDGIVDCCDVDLYLTAFQAERSSVVAATRHFSSMSTAPLLACHPSHTIRQCCTLSEHYRRFVIIGASSYPFIGHSTLSVLVSLLLLSLIQCKKKQQNLFSHTQRSRLIHERETKQR